VRGNLLVDGTALALALGLLTGCDDLVFRTCDRDTQLCNRPCFATDECDDGHACTRSDASVAVRLALVPPEDDGGTEEDAGYDPEEDAGFDPETPEQPEPSEPDAAVPSGQRAGFCERACRTELCPIDQVCSSGAGFCEPGCDETHMTCGTSELCDYQAKECRNRKGSCTADDVDTCFAIPNAFRGLAQRSCLDEQCRIDPKPVSSTGFEDLPLFGVRFPKPGDRITHIEDRPFEIKPVNPVTVLAIVTEQPEGLPELQSGLQDSVLWIAYVNGRKKKVSLDDGGAVIDGKWSQASPALEPKQPLFLVALGYNRGKLRSATVVPFSTGPDWETEGVTKCRTEGARCDNDRDLLVCVDERCRRTCLSDDDCTTGSCSPPKTPSRVRACL
jgi:hypothetical protein